MSIDEIELKTDESNDEAEQAQALMVIAAEGYQILKVDNNYRCRSNWILIT